MMKWIMVGMVGIAVLAGIEWQSTPGTPSETRPLENESGGGDCRPWHDPGPCLPRIRPKKGAPQWKSLSLSSVFDLFTNYGVDNRLDATCLSDPDTGELPQSVKATPALFLRDRFHEASDHWQFKERPITLSQAQATPLCPDEAFSSQPTGAYCSAVLISPGTLLTSSGCLGEAPSETLLVAFGFRVGGGQPLTSLKKAETCDVESAVRLGQYLALLEIACPPGLVVEPVPMNPTPRVGDAVSVIGYPKGLPAKHAGGATIRVIAGTRFHADLDVFSGNSGSPVFDAEGKVVGIVAEDPGPQLCPDSENPCWRWDSLRPDSKIHLNIQSTRLAVDHLKAQAARQEN